MLGMYSTCSIRVSAFVLIKLSYSFNIPLTYAEPKWDIDIFGEPEEANATHKAPTS